ncbi:MAG TPA: nickel-dependent lactate racemase [Candidatus Blautia excrementipullorum]|nr:nickel-dependent lactate racemase [Candidatus Blautia excrementipullorum]
MKITLGFGDKEQEVRIPDKNIQEVLAPNQIVHGLSGDSEVQRALINPIGSQRLKEIVKPGEKIAIVTSDITRPMPTNIVMPLLLEELKQAGVDENDVTLVFALGSHRKHTVEEKKKLAGIDIYTRIRCVDSNPEDCIRLGVTAHGTPVNITRAVAEADRRICLGNIEYHYFAGYSGGAKAIMPGVSTREAIQSNHSLMVNPNACVGNITANPLRKDIEEAAELCGIDFILNVVLDEHKKIIYACAGDAVKAHREGCKFLDKIYRKKIQKRSDIVIVSQGGAPKDLNLYQTQKALDNAKHAVKDGGTIILVGSCREGMGEKNFEQWMLEAKKPQELIERIRKDFRLGGHKAAAIALVLERAEIYLVSELKADFVRSIFMKPYDTVQDAFEAALHKHGKDASVIVMPYGGSTLPQAEF